MKPVCLGRFGLSLCLLSVLACNPSVAQDTVAKPNVLVLATGGTIAQTTTKDATLLGDALLSAVPELKKIANLTAEQTAQVSSPDITPEIWLTLAKRINEALRSDKYAGIVVTHGTDTMEETAYFLDLVVKSDKPVVIVGSMRGSVAPSADGPANLINAVSIAADPATKGLGVLVTLNDTVYAARDVTKTNTTSLDTFKSPDFGALGIMQGGHAHIYRRPIRKHTTGTEFDVSDVKSLPDVQIIYSYVGIGPAPFRQAVSAGAKGIVYAGTGNGSIPKSVQPAVIEAIRQGVEVVRSSRVNGGLVEHSGEHNDEALGTVSGDTLNPQKARVLLMLTVAKSMDRAATQRAFDQY